MFRFTIRDVLWLTVVVGMGLGWFVDHRMLKQYGKMYWTAFGIIAQRISIDGYKATLAGDRLIIELPHGGTEITILKD